LLVAAQAKGWAITKRDPEIVESGPGQLAFLKDVDDAFLARADDLIVISSGADEAYAASLRGHEGDPRPALRRTARRFATASRLMEHGATVIEGRALEAEVPGFGLLKPEPADDASAAMSDMGDMSANPLAIYDTLPPPAGAAAQWSTDLFSYTHRMEPEGGTPEIDMCGGTRILVHGPHLALSKGRWRATARFTVEPEDEAFLMFEWGTGIDVTTCNGAFSVAGSYEVVMERVWDELGAAEFRVWAERSHLFGKMTWLGCRVERLADELPI
jgi:hypothetical protein